MYRIMFKLESKERGFMIWGHLGAAGTKMASKNEISEVFWARPNSGNTANKLLYLILSVFHHSWHWNSICTHCYCHAICFLLNSGWKHENLAWPKRPLRRPFLHLEAPGGLKSEKVLSPTPNKIKFCTLYKSLGFLIANCFYPLSAPPA